MNKNFKDFRTTLIITVILISALFHACENEESITTDMEILTETVASFVDHEELKKTLNIILAMNEEELKNYEESKGYKSFGRASEEFYRSIKWDEFESKEDIISFVEQNSHYLKLIEDENGELELETKFYKRTDRYFLNLDNIYQIGESIYKAFEEGTVIANVKDLNVLKNRSNQFDFFKTDERFVVMESIETEVNTSKSTNENCGTSHVWRSTNGNNRLKVELWFNIWYNQTIPISLSHTVLDAMSRARPYKRTLGIWFWCTRTMMIDAQYSQQWWESDDCWWEWQLLGGWNSGEWDHYEPYTSTSKMEELITITTCSPSPDVNPSFLYYDVYADTYSVSPISVSCYSK